MIDVLPETWFRSTTEQRQFLIACQPLPLRTGSSAAWSVSDYLISRNPLELIVTGRIPELDRATQPAGMAGSLRDHRDDLSNSYVTKGANGLEPDQGGSEDVGERPS